MQALEKRMQPLYRPHSIKKTLMRAHKKPTDHFNIAITNLEILADGFEGRKNSQLN